MSLENLLKNHNLKITNSRLEVLNLINSLDINATKKNIILKSNIDKSTVYRILEVLLKENVIEKNLNYNNQVYYSIVEEHVHYIKCIKCHKRKKIDICPIPNLEKTGFKIISHKIEIDGTCANCSK